MQPIDALVQPPAGLKLCGINPGEREQTRKSWGEGKTDVKARRRLAQDREEEMRSEDRKGEENIRRITKGETLTSEMLSGLIADMTAPPPVPVDGAIGLPSPTARCPLVEQHSAALYCLSGLCWK